MMTSVSVSSASASPVNGMKTTVTCLPRSSSSSCLLIHKADRQAVHDHHPLLPVTQESQLHHSSSGTQESAAERPSSRNHSSTACLTIGRFSQWVHCVAVVTFDIEEGQSIEKIFPANVKLTDREKTTICYLSFPDSNSGCMGDTQYHFRAKLCPDSLKRPFPVDSESQFLYGFVYFRQTRDRTAKRGYFQKSLVLLTKLPFIALFKTVVSILANDYFDQGDDVLHRACRDMSNWPTLKSGSREKLSLLSTVMQVTIPDEEQNSGSLIGTGLSETNGSSSSGSGTLSEKSASSTLFLTLDPSAGMLRNGSFGSLHSPSKSPSFTRGFAPSPTIAIPSLNESNLFKCFFPVMTHIQTLWELVLTCEPLVVMAATPDVVSEVVQALVTAIRPLRYAADFRPFFTIHDTEFKDFTSTQTAPPAILGVTNPFFAKTLNHWPHIIWVGECSSPIRSSKKGLLRGLTDLSPGFQTKYKAFLMKDKTLQRQIDQGVESQRASEVQSALIRKHLSRLTHSFLMPLERYLTCLMPLQKSISPYKSAPGILPFDQEAFFKLLQLSGPEATSGIRGDWVSLYRKFFRCANFRSWYEDRCHQVNVLLNQMHIKSILSADLLKYAREKSEVEVVDLVLTLKDKIRSLDGDDAHADERHKLLSIVKGIVKLLPPDLHPILSKS